jgi:Replication-relaxation
MGRSHEPRQQGTSSSSGAGARPLRVSAERLFELARHLTERDREVALYLYRHRVLTTDQLQLLFFSSRRRAQDRLLFLYRNRVLDRFYPARPFSSGKPEAHWLLDEAGAILIAAMHDVERKQLGWQRRDDWGSHPQLAHQLETNRFLTDLIAATLSDPGLGVSEWWPPAEAADHLNERRRGRVLPDAGFYLETPAGPIECYLEWDRATETQQRLAEKLLAYRRAEAELFDEGKPPRCILFVVPGPRRLTTLRRAFGDFERERARRGSRGSIHSLHGSWPLIATSASRLHAEGHLATVWERLDERSGLLVALTDLPVRDDMKPPDLSATLGRRWRKDDPDFWRRLSPLGAGRQDAAAEEDGPVPPRPTDPEAEAFVERLRRLREADLEEARRDAAAFGAANPDRDLRSSAINGSMDDREDDVEEESWR